MKEKTNLNVHWIWAMTLLLIFVMLSITMVIINHVGWTISFEMDNNTLEAIKSINWTVLKKG